MTAPIREIFSWMVSTLQADAEMISLGFTKVFAYKAPEDFTFPYVILEKQSGAHSYNFGVESFNRHWITVKSVHLGTDGGDLGRRAQDRIRELLSNKRPSLTEGYTMMVRANTDYEYVEAEAGNFQFYPIGTVYFVQLSG